MSHEIRTPLNGTIGALELLLTSDLEPDQAMLGNTAQTCASNLLHIINDILDFSKLEDGSLSLEAIPFSLIQLIDETVTMTRELAADQGIALEVIIEPRVPALVVGDPTRIKQVLLNLVSNAIKFSPPGAITIRAEGSVSDDNQFDLDLRVIDHGIGIAAEAIPHLFTPFTQAESSTTRRFGGTGLGLAICKHIVTCYDGTIDVDSRPGAGTTICVHLPLPIAGPATQLALDSAAQHQLTIAGHRVLVAEDNPVNQMVIQRQLAQLDLTTTLVADGSEAVAAAASERFDLILMDCHMPVLDGFDAARQIRSQEAAAGHAAVPIIAVTANALEGDRDACLGAGMDDYLSKPVTIASLTRCCHTWLTSS